MIRLNISNNQLCGHWKTPDFSGFKALAAAIEQHELLTMDTVDMSEALTVSGQNLGTAGAKMMAAFVKGNGALTSLDISNNQLYGHWKSPDFSGFQALATAIEQHKLLTMDAVDMSEALDVSGQKLGSHEAKMMATFIKYNGALTSLNLASNVFGVEGAKFIAAVLPDCT
jgi:hypothetical protein